MAQALAADVFACRCGSVQNPCVLRRPVSARPRCNSALAVLQCVTSRVAPARAGPGSKRRFTCSVGAQQRQDPVQQARTTQEQTTKLLAELLQAPDTAATARAHVDAIDEEFFMVSSTYLDMARQEGNKEVCTKLEQVLKIAMEEKQKTLRPEIQLLNNLMAATTVPERERVLNHDEAKTALVMNNGYFFGLLDRMISDVGRQPDNSRKKDVMDQLQQINKRTHAQRQSVNR
ncbi:hypothetical protein ABBQ32_006723 [Trebouxia sp. C0010 RCD-2024]